jgi:hypothetical protein
VARNGDAAREVFAGNRVSAGGNSSSKTCRYRWKDAETLVDACIHEGEVLEICEMHVGGSGEGSSDLIDQPLVSTGSSQKPHKKAGEERCGCLGAGNDEQGRVEDNLVLRHTSFFVLPENVVQEVTMFSAKAFIDSSTC